jgi:hypothetical protein
MGTEMSAGKNGLAAFSTNQNGRWRRRHRQVFFDHVSTVNTELRAHGQTDATPATKHNSAPVLCLEVPGDSDYSGSAILAKQSSLEHRLVVAA